MKNAKKVETRHIDTKTTSVELREANGKRVLVGKIPYDSLSKDLGGFREKIQRGAFNKTLSDGFDVRALVNHDHGKVLGRIKNQTLTLEDREDGLYATIELGNQSYSNDLWESIKRDDISTLSFGFRTIHDSFERGSEASQPVIRTLKEVHLIEISYGVAFPAYEETNTTAALRSIYDAAGVNIELFNNALLKGQAEEELTEEEIESLRAIQTWIEQRVASKKTTQEESPTSTPLDVLERELDLIERSENK